MKNITRHDSGNYSCYAMNILTPSGHTKQNRTDEWMFVINVQYAPSTKILEAPRFEILEYNNMTIHCTVTDANPIFSSISWYRNTTNPLANTANYTINSINRSDAGYYICDARNTVGNGRTSVYINVLYGPVIKSLIVTNGSTVMENSTVVLICEIDSNPVPTVKWTFNNEPLADNGLMGEISYYTIMNTNCFHTGTYGCSAINNISSMIYNASKEVQLIINCSPTLNINMAQPPRKIGLPLGGTLDINVNIVAYPLLSTTEWTFQPNLTNVTYIINGTLESILFRHKLQLHKSNLSEFDFGDYILDVKNILGSKKLFFQVVPEGPPEPSTLINVTCSLQTILVFWITSFSGGGTQNFSIIAVNENKQNHINTDVVSSAKGEIKHTSFNLPPSEYKLSILGENRYASAISTNSMSCKVKDTPKTEKRSIIAAAAGGGVGAAVILIGFTVLGLLIVRKRRKLKGKRFGECGRKLTNEDTDEGLKDNPLYGTTQSRTINSGPLNCQVNKTPLSEEGEQEFIDERCVYSQVQKNNKKGIKQKDIEMGSVYENSDKIMKNMQTEEMYSNTEGDTSTKQNQTVQSLPSKKNKDGLIYADLDLAPSGKQFVIRGIENRNNYAIIDLTKKAKPLPFDDEDVEQDDK